MKILVLEDDLTLAKEIKKFFLLKKCQCDLVYDGSLLIKQFVANKYDCVILDINVPNKNGLEVCSDLRAYETKIPIIMLTAFGEIDDKITAFNAGADDYIVKPFHFEELYARIKALERRKDIPVNIEEVYILEDLEINKETNTVTRSGKSINLTPKEFKLLCILAHAKGKVVSKQYIAEELWDYIIENNLNTIEVYINFLRKKIDKDFNKKLIHTKIGYGYYLKSEE